jgi:hypothetical protein
VVRKREWIDTAAVADQRLALMRDHGSGLPLEARRRWRSNVI